TLIGGCSVVVMMSPIEKYPFGPIGRQIHKSEPDFVVSSFSSCSALHQINLKPSGGQINKPVSKLERGSQAVLANSHNIVSVTARVTLRDQAWDSRSTANRRRSVFKAVSEKTIRGGDRVLNASML